MLDFIWPIFKYHINQKWKTLKELNLQKSTHDSVNELLRFLVYAKFLLEFYIQKLENMKQNYYIFNVSLIAVKWEKNVENICYISVKLLLLAFLDIICIVHYLPYLKTIKYPTFQSFLTKLRNFFINVNSTCFAL